MDSADFTLTEIVDGFQIGYATIDMVGYVTKVNNNLHSSKSSKFHKFVLNNAAGREVQVIAWNSNTAKLNIVKVLESIVHVGSVMCAIVKNKNFNSANVNFELLVKENTTITVYGVYKPKDEELYIEEVSIPEAYKKIGQTIKLDGIIKTEPGHYKNRDYESTVASVTDCEYHLELKLNFDCSNMKLLKGTSVVLTGVMEQYPPGSAVLRIDRPEDVNILDSHNRVAFEDILRGYRTKVD